MKSHCRVLGSSAEHVIFLAHRPARSAMSQHRCVWQAGPSMETLCLLRLYTNAARYPFPTSPHDQTLLPRMDHHIPSITKCTSSFSLLDKPSPFSPSHRTKTPQPPLSPSPYPHAPPLPLRRSLHLNNTTRSAPPYTEASRYDDVVLHIPRADADPRRELQHCNAEPNI